jgi:hypothetical protein
MRTAESVLLSATERASKAIVWNTSTQKVAGFAGLYEAQGDWTRPAGVVVHGLGVARNQHGWYVEAYCECARSEFARARQAVAAHVGVGLPARSVVVVPCAGFLPSFGAGDPTAHAVLAPGGYGTLGGYANDLLSQLVLAVSNNHVFVNNNQPTPPDDLVDTTAGQVFGRMHRFWPLRAQPALNDLDAAVGWIAEDYPIRRTPRLNGLRLPAQGLRVQKRGASAGHTTGTIQSVAATALVPYPGLGQVNFARCLRIVGDNGPFSSQGDSGSLVLDMTNAVVGIIFAGETNGAFSLANWGTTLTRRLDIAF